MLDLIAQARSLRRWAVAVVAAILLLGTPASAYALSAVASDPGTGGAGICQVTNAAQAAQAESEYLMVNRWAPATSNLHSRLSATVWDDVPAKVQRGVNESGMLGFGNGAWILAINLTEGASRFCLSDRIGVELDRVAGALGRALNQSGLLVMALLIGFGALVWRARRGGMQWGGMVRIVVTLALFGFMLNGASNSNGATFGTGSPGWIASKINATVSGMAAAPAKALSTLTAQQVAPFKSTGSLSCGAYIASLRQRYEAQYGAGTSAFASTVPMTLDDLWAASGLKVYVATQFGVRNTYGEHMFCRQLEANAGVPGDEQASLTGGGAPSAAAAAFNQRSDNILIDRAMIGWAACTPGIDGQWSAAGVVSADCATWASVADHDLNRTTLNFEDDIAGVVELTKSSPAVRDFVLTYHGQTDRSSTAYLLVYDIAAVIVLILFGGLALGLYAAKLAMTFVLMLVMFVALRDLMRPSEDSALVGVLKQYAGMALYCFGLGAILGLMAYFTSALAGLTGDGSVLAVGWSAVCPLIVAWIIAYVLKNVFKAPSLFRPTSALKWGAAGGVLGAGIGIGADRLLNRGNGMARSMGRSMGRSASDKVFGVGGHDSGLASMLKRRKRGQSAAAGVGAAAGAAAAYAGAAAGHRKDNKGAEEGLSETLDAAAETGRRVAPSMEADAREAMNKGRAILAQQARTQRETEGGFSEAGGFYSRWSGRAANRTVISMKQAEAALSGAPARLQAAVTAARAHPWNAARTVARATGTGARRTVKVAGLTAAAIAMPVAGAPVLAAGAALYGVRRLARRADERRASGAAPVYSSSQVQALRAYTAQQQAQATQKALLDAGDAPAPVVVGVDDAPLLLPPPPASPTQPLPITPPSGGRP